MNTQPVEVDPVSNILASILAVVGTLELQKKEVLSVVEDLAIAVAMDKPTPQSEQSTAMKVITTALQHSKEPATIKALRETKKHLQALCQASEMIPQSLTSIVNAINHYESENAPDVG